MKITKEEKAAAVEAGKNSIKRAWKKMEGRNLKWWERLLWVVLAGAAAVAGSLLYGCGHTVNVKPDETKVCKDGACLVVTPEGFSYSQEQTDTGIPPVVQEVK